MAMRKRKELTVRWGSCQSWSYCRGTFQHVRGVCFSPVLWPGIGWTASTPAQLARCALSIWIASRAEIHLSRSFRSGVNYFQDFEVRIYCGFNWGPPRTVEKWEDFFFFRLRSGFQMLVSSRIFRPNNFM